MFTWLNNVHNSASNICNSGNWRQWIDALWNQVFRT